MFGAHGAMADFAAGAQAYDGGDYVSAYAEWHVLAEAGDARAQTAIAGMYRFGEGRPVDLAAAVKWYRRAARRNDAVAQMNLGEMYRRGLGVARDMQRAWMWFAIAAEQGAKWAGQQLTTLERTMPAQDIGRARRLLEALKEQQQQ